MKSRDRRGSALVVSLIAIVTLAAVGAAFLRITTSLTSRQTDDVENMKAFYLAEAGLAEGFQAVRMGRTGQLGSQEAPATYGDGLLWVDATATVDEQVRLESTALVGRGRASLAYVVEPVDIPLGFFGDQELVVESVLLVDGYDSAEETYAEAVAVANPLPDLKAYADWLQGVIGNGTFDTVVTGPDIVADRDYSGKLGALAAAQLQELASMQPMLRKGYPNGYDPAGPYGGSQAGSLEVVAQTDSEEGTPTSVPSVIGPTTGAGGLLGSNGDIQFLAGTEDPVAIHGDITPGPSGSIVGLDGSSVTGSTAARPQRVDLPEVVVPPVALGPAVRHEALLPLLVTAGSVGYERIEVAADSELILKGPSTVVIGTLILEPGATLSLDTRDGNVALYITVEMDLQAGSLVTTSENPREATVLVSEIPTGVGGAPIRLDATAQFHGTVYAPLTDVRIGGSFEVFGGVIARRLEIGAGARLHFDNAEFESSPLPRIVSWRIIEIPNAVRGARDPFEHLGLNEADLDPLAKCHDLAAVEMIITYVDLGGAVKSYEGTESLFDWDLVAKVIEVDRDPERKPDPEGDVKLPPVEPPKDILSSEEQDLLAAIQAGTLTSAELEAKLEALAPVADAVLTEALLAEPGMGEWDLYDALLANGPTGPGYPGAKGTVPLGDAVLLKAIQDSPLGSQSLSWVLEQNSPLSADVLAAARTRVPPLKNGDLNRVENAQ